MTVEVLADGTLAGRSALVTGAGSGIGRAITLRLIALGARVTGVGRHEDTLAETGSMARGAYDYAVCDVRDVDAATEVVDRVGEAHGIDVLVNNAGGQFFAAATQISANGWKSVVDLNLTSVFTMSKAAYPYLARRHGAVVNLSLSGVERGSMGFAHSIAARAGVLGLTRTLALEWAADRVRLNCIGPGTVLTTGFAEESVQLTVDRFVGATPLGRATEAEEVAELVAFLASDAGTMITGQLLQIDGGAHLGPGLHAVGNDR